MLSETSTEKVTKFGAAANYEDGLTKFGGGIAWERTATTKHIKRGSVQGLMRCTNPNTFVIKDIARWIVNQNPDDPGIPAFMATAMLVRRPSHDRIFAATVKITADVDSAKATLANKWDEIVGKVPKVDPVYFNPALPPKGTMPVPRGLKTNDIGDYWEALVKGEVSC